MTTVRPVEVELKYRVADPATARSILDGAALGELRGSDIARSAQTEDRYVDTPDGAMARAGFAARLRRTAGGDIISVKSLGATRHGSLARREELEGPAVRGDAPSDWPPSAARSLVLELCGDAYLVELVTVRQLRHRRHFGAEGGALVEVSLDEVDVVVSGRIVEHFTELEVELIAGPEDVLDSVAAVLDGVPSLEADPASKLERALRVAGIPVPRTTSPTVEEASMSSPPEPDLSPEAPVPPEPGIPSQASGQGDGGNGEAPVDVLPDRPATEASEPAGATPEVETPGAPPAEIPRTAPAAVAEPVPGARARPPRPTRPKLVVGKTPGVRGDDTLAEAGRKVLRFHFARMLAREAGTRDGHDAEELHAMRVATRRMRAAFRVFGEAYRPGRIRRHRRDLRDVARRLGAVRDMDVLIESLEAYAAAQPGGEREGLEPLLAAWRSQRDDARVLLLRTLDSENYRRFTDGFLEFVRTEGMAVAPVSPTAPHRVRDEMPAHIWNAYAQVRAYEPVLRWADVETLHDLRIAAKWLRYTMEFVREPLGDEAGPLIERVVALQDHLGWLHDADVASGLARSFLVDHAADIEESETAAIGRYLVDRERELARLRRTVGGPWRRVAGLAFRRGLGRVVAGL